MWLNMQHPLYEELQEFISKSEINSEWYNQYSDQISLIEDWIEIQWLAFDIVDLSIDANNIDIWKHNGLTYFTFDAANKYAQLTWKRLPTREEWKALIDFLPWAIENKVDFLMSIMKFPLSWFRCWDNSFFCNYWEDSWYWSSSWTVTHWYNLLFKKNYLNYWDFDFKGIWFLVRCLKK